MIASRSDGPSGRGVLFRYAFASGERRTYALDMNVDLKPSSGEQVQTLKSRVRAKMVVSVVAKRADGSTVLKLSLDDVETSPQRANTAGLQAGSVKLRIGSDGRVLDVEGTGGVFSLAGVDPSALVTGQSGGSDGAGSQLFFPQFPTDRIAPGDEWSNESSLPLPFGNKRVAVRADGRFVGYEDSQRGRAARLELDVTTPLDYSVTIADLTKAAGRSPLQSAVPDDAKITIDGRNVTDARALILPGTSELMELTGTTTLSTRMTIEGVPSEQLEGARTAYAFEATVRMSIVRVED